jgi:hypothetical protein
VWVGWTCGSDGRNGLLLRRPRDNSVFTSCADSYAVLSLLGIFSCFSYLPETSGSCEFLHEL